MVEPAGGTFCEKLSGALRAASPKVAPRGTWREGAAIAREPQATRSPTVSGRQTNPDLLVIGGGAGGLAAVRAGARRGARTVLVQAKPGGDCTFTGCVPSKTLIEAAARGESLTGALAAAATAVATVAAAEDDAMLPREGVEVVHGWATFRGPLLVDVDGVRFRPRHVVVATGARPELIGEAALAARTGMFVGSLAQTVHPYRTWAIALRQAAAQFFFEVGDRRARPAAGGESHDVGSR